MKPDKNFRWTANILNKEKLTHEDAKFVFEQVEKQVKDSIETAAIIVNRTSSLLTIISGLIIGLTAYIIQEWEGTSLLSNMLISAIAGDIYLFIIGFLCVLNIRPRTYKPAGSLP